MTKEKEPIKIEDFQRGAYVALLKQYTKNSEKPHQDANVLGAADVLRESLDLGKDGISAYEGYINNKQIDNLINVYDEKYNYETQLSKATISELHSWHEPVLNGASDEQKALIKTEIDKFGNEDYGKIMEKYLSAKEITESKTKNFSEKQKKAAEKEVKKYEKIVIVLSNLNSYTLKSLEPKVIEASKKHAFGGLEQMLKEEDKTGDKE